MGENWLVTFNAKKVKLAELYSHPTDQEFSSIVYSLKEVPGFNLLKGLKLT